MFTERGLTKYIVKMTPKQVFNQHQSLSGEILPHFDINNLSVGQKLKKLEISLNYCRVRYEGGVW